MIFCINFIDKLLRNKLGNVAAVRSKLFYNGRTQIRIFQTGGQKNRIYLRIDLMVCLCDLKLIFEIGDRPQSSDNDGRIRFSP